MSDSSTCGSAHTLHFHTFVPDTRHTSVSRSSVPGPQIAKKPFIRTETYHLVYDLSLYWDISWVRKTRLRSEPSSVHSPLTRDPEGWFA